MIETILKVSSIILFIVDIFFVLNIIIKMFKEKTLKKKIWKKYHEYNQKMEEFWWYYDGDEELQGIKKLADRYTEIQHMFEKYEGLYDKFYKKFYKKIEKMEEFQQFVIKMNRYREERTRIKEKGFFVKHNRRRTFKRNEKLEINRHIQEDKKSPQFQVLEFNIKKNLKKGLVIVFLGILIGYIVQFLWLDGLYYVEIIDTFKKLLRYFIFIIPVVLGLIYNIVAYIYFNKFWDNLFNSILIWFIWSIVFMPLAILGLIGIYSIKNMPYTIILLKEVIYPDLCCLVLPIFLLNEMSKKLLDGIKVLKDELMQIEKEVRNIKNEEYENRLRERLRELEYYVNILFDNVVFDEMYGEKQFENMSIPEKMHYIINDSSYHIKLVHMNEKMKKEIIHTFYDYQRMSAILKIPFASVGKENFKRMKENLDKLLNDE